MRDIPPLQGRLELVLWCVHSSVPNDFPDYLRLHKEEITEPALGTPREFERLCACFNSATGYEMEVAARETSTQLEFPWSESRAPTFQVSLAPLIGVVPTNLRLKHRRELEESFAALLNTLAATRHALRIREAELATMQPIVSIEHRGEHLGWNAWKRF